MKQPLLEVKHLSHRYYAHSARSVYAVRDLNFVINEGETFGLVGESGCGKSTTGRAILRLFKPAEGEIIFKGKSINRQKNRQERENYRRGVQMIFQDPYSSLDPKMTVEDIIGEGMENFGLVKNRKEKREEVSRLLDMVGLRREYMNRYPHEFSGGQRQRIGIARALAVTPELVVCDEPISSLDVSIQAQIVNLLKDLQQEKHLSYLFIAHDLSMVKYISDRIGVMYKGRLVEMGSVREVYNRPLHPYTKSLLSMIPLPEPLLERARHPQYYEAGDMDREGLKLREAEPGHYIYCDENGDF
ncbi:MAG: ATP-binding cassette domain-containing protein [Clostridiales bacterium]|nr:ATP-binding cassette domain-containing protein [Clostridiales bacterium]